MNVTLHYTKGYHICVAGPSEIVITTANRTFLTIKNNNNKAEVYLGPELKPIYILKDSYSNLTNEYIDMLIQHQLKQMQ